MNINKFFVFICFVLVYVYSWGIEVNFFASKNNNGVLMEILIILYILNGRITLIIFRNFLKDRNDVKIRKL